MNTVKIAVAAALLAAATTSAMASGLNPADPQFVNGQSASDTLQTNARQRPVTTGQFNHQAPLSDAERNIIDHQKDHLAN